MSENAASTIAVTVLTGLFVYLKASGMIDWSWIWVFSPIWIPFILVIFFGIMFLIATYFFNKRM